jgi:hypothetical protein
MRFEYKTIVTETKGFMAGKVSEEEFEASFNELGAQGWELVSSVASAEGYGTTKFIVSIFKRPAL